jgi:hypothetical protein
VIPPPTTPPRSSPINKPRAVRGSGLVASDALARIPPHPAHCAGEAAHPTDHLAHRPLPAAAAPGCHRGGVVHRVRRRYTPRDRRRTGGSDVGGAGTPAHRRRVCPGRAGGQRPHHHVVPADRRPAQGIVARVVHRHHALIDVPAGVRTPYRVASVTGAAIAVSDTFTVRGPFRPGEPAVIMLTSDHQLTVNTAANLHFAAATITSAPSMPCSPQATW